MGWRPTIGLADALPGLAVLALGKRSPIPSSAEAPCGHRDFGWWR